MILSVTMPPPPPAPMAVRYLTLMGQSTLSLVILLATAQEAMVGRFTTLELSPLSQVILFVTELQMVGQFVTTELSPL